MRSPSKSYPLKVLRTLFCSLGLPVLALGQAVINEIHYHPASNDDREEFIEIYNANDAPLDLTGWQMSSGVSFTFPAGTSLPASGYLILASNPPHLLSLHPELDPALTYGPWSGRLSNRGETLRLRNGDNETVDRVDYANEGEFAEREWSTDFRQVRGIQWKALHSGGGRTLELRQPGLSNNRGANWASSQSDHGTPGRLNSRAVSNLAPIISDAQHSPPIPSSDQAVQIHFEIEDEAIAGTHVELFYRVNESLPEAAALRRIPGGSETRQSFIGSVPPQDNHTVIEYYIQARDPQEASMTWPPPTLPLGAQDANALYQVDDRARSPDLPEYRIVMTPSEQDRFINTVIPRVTLPDGSRPENQKIYSDARFNATFISYFDGEYKVHHRTEVRNRGNGSRQRSPNNFRIDFASDALWNGVEKLNANAQFPWLQTLGATLSHELGLIAAPSRLVHVYLNENLRAPNAFATYELYAANDVMNSDFAREYDLGNANIYRGIRQSGTEEADFQYLGEDPAPYRRVYFKETNKIDDDWTDLIALTKALSTSSDETFEQETQQQIDVPQWMRFLASETFYANQESALGSGYGDDYYLYRSVRDQRFRLIPYDHDTILGQGDTSADPREQIWRATRGAAINRLLTWPHYTPLYYSNLVQLATGPLSPERLAPVVKRLYQNTKVPLSRQEQLVEFADARARFLLETIPRKLEVIVPFPESNGVYRAPNADSPLPFITGRADATQTTRVTVNDQPALWNPVGASWTYLVTAFRPGLNVFTVRAFDSSDQMIEEKRLSIFRPIGDGFTEVTELIQGTQLWSSEQHPIRVLNDLMIAPDSQLKIEPGVVVEFSPNARIIVQGKLTVTGSESSPILFTGQANQTWGGIVIQSGGTVSLQHASIQHVGATSERAVISLEHATLNAQHTRFRLNTGTCIDAIQSHVTLRNCHFTEVEEGSALQVSGLDSGHVIQIDECVFGQSPTSSPLLSIRQTNGVSRPFALRNSVFELDQPSALDMDHPLAVISGNRFVMPNLTTPDTDSQTLLQIRNPDAGEEGRLIFARNYIASAGSALTLEGPWNIQCHNNTFNDLLHVIQQRSDDSLSGEWINNLHRSVSSIMADTTAWARSAITFQSNITTDELDTSMSLIPPDFLGLHEEMTDQGIRSNSPLKSSGFGGHDIGASARPIPTQLQDIAFLSPLAHVPLRLWAPGVDRFTIQTQATDGTEPLPVSVTNGSRWQAELLPDTRQSYRVEARDLSDQVIAHTDLTLETVEALSPIHLSEVSAASDIDWIEISNPTNQPIDLSGYSVSDNPASPKKYTFSSGTQIPPFDFIVIESGTAEHPTGKLPFRLDSDGESIHLYDPSGTPIDTLQFGRQIKSHTLARSVTGTWVLAHPSPGKQNVAAPVSGIEFVQLNEFLTKPTSADNRGEFIEIYNRSVLPVVLSQIHIDDLPHHPPLESSFPPFSYLGAQSYLALVEAPDGGQNQWPLEQGLRSSPSSISIRSLQGHVIDSIWHGPQRSGVALGRSQTGELVSFDRPTPGLANDPEGLPAPPIEVTLVSLSHPWEFNEQGTDLGSRWYSDSLLVTEWSTGHGPFAGTEASVTPPQSTLLSQSPITTYFRTEFEYEGVIPPEELTLSLLVDDGAIVYLNDEEVARIRMPSRLPTHARTLATEIETPVWMDIRIVRPNLIQPGPNRLAVELHQSRTGTKDAVFALTLRSLMDASEPHKVLINEVLADNRSFPTAPGTAPSDWIELYNPTAFPIDLSALALSDALSLDRMWSFPTGSTLHGQSRMIVHFDSSQPSSDSNTGFGLSSSGDGVFLFAQSENAIEMIDSLVFGFQASDVSLARLPPDQQWGSALPSPNQPNIAAPVGDPFALRINEWLARSDQGSDWLELYNPSAGSINLHGFTITDDLGDPSQHIFPPYSILGMGAGAWRQLFANNQPEDGATHLNFRLAGSGESIALYHPTGTLIDAVHFGPQAFDQSEGRLPDGSPQIAPLATPSPQASNDQDQDLDGMDDQWEIAHGLNPNDPMDAHFDLDQDGLSNLEEFKIGTLPNSIRSGLSITDIEVSSSHIRLTFDGISGRGFLIRSKPSLDSETWTERWRVEIVPETGPIAVELLNEFPNQYFQVVSF